MERSTLSASRLSSYEPDLLERHERCGCGNRLLFAGKRIEAGQLSQVNPATRFNRANGDLGRDVELWRREGTEYELFFGFQGAFLVHLVAGGTQLTGLVVDEGYDLPERARDAHAIHLRVLGAEERPCKDRNLHLVFTRVLQRIVLEREPDRCVECLHLRRRIGDVHRILVAAFWDCRRAPTGILTPGHMAAAEFRRAAVTFLHDLLRFWNARVPLPCDTRALARLAAIDVAGAEEAHPPAAAHHHGIVRVA